MLFYLLLSINKIKKLDEEKQHLKLVNLALELTIEKEGMLGEMIALFQDMPLEPGLQQALKWALHAMPLSGLNNLSSLYKYL